jgi:hypothetical protein
MGLRWVFVQGGGEEGRGLVCIFDGGTGGKLGNGGKEDGPECGAWEARL